MIVVVRGATRNETTRNRVSDRWPKELIDDLTSTEAARVLLEALFSRHKPTVSAAVSLLSSVIFHTCVPRWKKKRRILIFVRYITEVFVYIFFLLIDGYGYSRNMRWRRSPRPTGRTPPAACRRAAATTAARFRRRRTSAA